MATRLLDAADKVPSLHLEQEFAPGQSRLESLVAAGLGCRRSPLAHIVPHSALRRAAGAH